MHAVMPLTVKMREERRLQAMSDYLTLITKAMVAARSGAEPSTAPLQSMQDVAESWWVTALRKALVSCANKGLTPAIRAAMQTTETFTLASGAATMSPVPLMELSGGLNIVVADTGIALSYEPYYADYINRYKDNRLGYYHIRDESTLLATFPGQNAGSSAGDVDVTSVFVPPNPTSGGSTIEIPASVEAELIPILASLIRADAANQEITMQNVRRAA